MQDPYNLRGSRSVSGFDVPHLLTVNMNYELPVGKGKLLSTGNGLLDGVLGRWQTNAIFLARTGQAYTVTAAGDIANTGNTGYMRANLVGDPSLSDPTPKKWFNTAAFAVPANYTFGNLGRNTMRSDRYWNLDFSVFRQFWIRERTRLELRAEAFNIFNTVVYGTPSAAVTSPSTFGSVTGLANSPRNLQFGAKFIF